MLFNSLDFALFLPVVFLLYWYVVNQKLKLQNLLILTASYIFYGWWDYRFLSLIFFSTIVDFSVGIQLNRTTSAYRRKVLLWLSIITNIGMLGFFKYYNFFLENFRQAFSFLGEEISAGSLNIILPVGISFYTFQTLSYTIDIYKKRLEPTQDFISFAAFVSFFPQLVAGPIERARNLLPQFQQHRNFSYQKAADGLRQILWGLFKKVVIADTCAEYVNQIFANSGEYSGGTLAVGAILFAFQIYGDFSGYSDIAIGTARLFGFNLMRNFAYPYFSRDIAEFWRRWHISLSTWFRDYLYIPLGGSRGRSVRVIRNILIIFIVSGFWHGANWTFIVWGLLNSVFFIPLLLSGSHRKNTGIVAAGRLVPSLKDFSRILITFGLTTLAWVFFRAESLSHALSYLAGLFMDWNSRLEVSVPTILWIFLGLFIAVEWLQRDKEHALDLAGVQMPVSLRWGTYLLTAFIVAIFFGSDNSFIYFQF